VLRESGVVHSFKMVDPILCLDLTSCIPEISSRFEGLIYNTYTMNRQRGRTGTSCTVTSLTYSIEQSPS
jgi:hypothetical protein